MNLLYSILFMVRYLPFWSIPMALVSFELGTYYFNRRQRIRFAFWYLMSGALMLGSILWLVLEGFWRAGPFVKKFLESFGIT